MTYAMAHSAATDVANRQMKANRRNMWNVDDYNLACRTLARLFPKCGANPNAGLQYKGSRRLLRTTGQGMPAGEASK